MQHRSARLGAARTAAEPGVVTEIAAVCAGLPLALAVASQLHQAREAWRQALAIFVDIQHYDADLVRAKLDGARERAVSTNS